MSFSYDETLPTAKDRIRHQLGDTVTPGLRSDEQIVALIAAYGETPATGMLASGLAAQYAQSPSSVSLPGGLSVTFAERVDFWKELSATLSAVVDVQGAANVLVSATPTRVDRVLEQFEYTREDYTVYPGPERWWYNDD